MKKKISLILFLAVIGATHLKGQDNQTSLSEKQEKVFLALAESLYAEGELSRSLSVYLDFIDLYPESRFTVRALENMANLYENLQMYQEALETYRTLFQRTGTSSSKGLSYYYNQARILNSMGEVEKAGRIYAEIVQISPDSPYAQKAMINNKLNDLFRD